MIGIEDVRDCSSAVQRTAALMGQELGDLHAAGRITWERYEVARAALGDILAALQIVRGVIEEAKRPAPNVVPLVKRG